MKQLQEYQTIHEFWEELASESRSLPLEQDREFWRKKLVVASESGSLTVKLFTTSEGPTLIRISDRQDSGQSKVTSLNFYRQPGDLNYSDRKQVAHLKLPDERHGLHIETPSALPEAVVHLLDDSVQLVFK